MATEHQSYIGLGLNSFIICGSDKDEHSASFTVCQHAIEQGVALTGRNRTGPPCIVSRPTAYAAGRPARPQRYRRRQTTDASEQNNTGPLCGPVIREAIVSQFEPVSMKPFCSPYMT